MSGLDQYDPSKFVHVEDIKISIETEELLKEASRVYNVNFDGNTWFGRCIFVSWYCSLADCTFCYRTTISHQKRHPETERRSMGSLLLEALFSRVFGWRNEFITGGYGIMPFPELLNVIKTTSIVYGNKVWLNLGVMSQEHLEQCKPYVEGIVGSMETVTPDLHKHVCPSKPIAPFEKMFEQLDGFKKSICIIVGLGDTIDDMKYLFDFVEKHKLDRVTMYALKPVRSTEYTHGPDTDFYLQWLARLRIRFPKLEIIAGTNLRRSEEVGYLMRAGANAITKFPATKQFGTAKARKVEELISAEGRTWVSTLTDIGNHDWDGIIDSLEIDDKYKIEMRDRSTTYGAFPPYISTCNIMVGRVPEKGKKMTMIPRIPESYTEYKCKDNNVVSSDSDLRKI